MTGARCDWLSIGSTGMRITSIDGAEVRSLASSRRNRAETSSNRADMLWYTRSLSGMVGERRITTLRKRRDHLSNTVITRAFFTYVCVADRVDCYYVRLCACACVCVQARVRMAQCKFITVHYSVMMCIIPAIVFGKCFNLLDCALTLDCALIFADYTMLYCF